MSLYFNRSNYIGSNIENIFQVQEVFDYSPQTQIIKVNNSKKNVFHICGAGGGGGYGLGGGGGSGFTILDFPYYPFEDDIRVELNIGKGGSGGSVIGSSTKPSQPGGDTIVRIYQGESMVILKEFVCYGGGPGQDYFDVSLTNKSSIKSGGRGGMNTKKYRSLMNAYYIQDHDEGRLDFEDQSISNEFGRQRYPYGGSMYSSKSSGDSTNIYYLSVSGAGGGCNQYVGDEKNDGGSFLFYEGGSGDRSQLLTGGGGGSSYFGKGGNGGNSSTNWHGTDGEFGCGCGGGGGSFLNNTTKGNGGNGSNGVVILEIYGGDYEIRK
jgi:hypothetical protein